MRSGRGAFAKRWKCAIYNAKKICTNRLHSRKRRVVWLSLAATINHNDSMKITYETADTWQLKKTTVGAPIWQRDPGSAFERHQTKVGVTLQALYWQPRNRRLIAETYSIWDDGRGCHKGTLFHEIALEEIADFARVHHTLEDVLVSLGFLPQILN